MPTRTLYLFSCAAPPVFDIAHVIEDAQADGWDVCLGLTPAAARWLGDSLDGLAVLTGHPVRWDYELPGQPEVWPPADAILLAPATFNTINQWALGLTDKFVVGVVAEGIGKRIPTVTMPCVNAAYAQHPAFERSVETLRAAGVTVLYGEGGFVPNQPGTPEAYPWGVALGAVRAEPYEPARGGRSE
ncbi:flavoprotein [Streptomyces sp. NBC_00691]|uniref:flavoprotein n=1 Tax=Streptomyces sp. NBC_00691 TaxID=2903671 RepID=UPI002E36A047|nr:flavoprotein [Streptomyces sp. NBC_00691]